MAIKEDILHILNDAAVKIRANMDANNINASHRTERSIRVEQCDGSIALVIGNDTERTAPLETLEVGRPAGNVPGGFRTMKNGKQDVSNTFKAILIQWARDKGIADFGWGQATVLGRRIARDGTNRHRHPVDTYSAVVNDATEKLEQTIEDGIFAAIAGAAQTHF